MTYNRTSKIKGALRQVSRYRPEVQEALQMAVSREIKGPRGGKMYICAECGNVFPITEVQADHKEPVIPIGKKTEDMTWDEIIDRMFCPPEDLQILCKPCHKEKSSKERKERKKCELKKKS